MTFKLKPADYISLASLACAVIAMSLIFIHRIEYVPWLIFLSIGLDYFDGYVARKIGIKNQIGPYLEGFIDSIAFGVVPPFFIASILGFDIITTALFVFVVVVNILREARILTLLETQSKYKTGMANPVFAAITAFLILSQFSIPQYLWQLFMLIGGFLLLSPFKYPTHRNISERMKYVFVLIVVIILAASFILTKEFYISYIIIALILIGYMIFGPIIYKWKS